MVVAFSPWIYINTSWIYVQVSYCATSVYDRQIRSCIHGRGGAGRRWALFDTSDRSSFLLPVHALVNYLGFIQTKIESGSPYECTGAAAAGGDEVGPHRLVDHSQVRLDRVVPISSSSR